jgi:cell wall-associated NlpC family hydrolase
MSTRIQSQRPAATSNRTGASASKEPAAPKRPVFRDELSTGKGRAHRASQAASAAPTTEDVDLAFARQVSALERAIARGVPGAKEELANVLRDRAGIANGIADVEAKLAANENPATWANVKPASRAKAEQAEARAQLKKQLRDLKEFGVKVAKMNPKQRHDLQNFFRLAKEDPEAFKRFVEAHSPKPNGGAAPVSGPAPSGAPANIQAAIDFGRSQVGAPYVGGASPFRFGTPGDGRTYQMAGQRAYVSQKGVIGYDCSGLMVTMLKKAGIDISRYGSSRAMKAGLPEVPKDQLQPGDLLVKNGHVAMYLGNGQMIESVPSGVRVTSASPSLNDPAYSGHRAG